MSIQGFIFDLDGVVTDTAEYHFLAWKRLADKLGWNFDREVNERLRGVSRMDSIRIILEHNKASMPDDELSRWANKKNENYVASLQEVTPDDYLPGARELLEEIKAEGFRIALGSSSKNARTVLDRLQALAYFDAIADGNSVSRSKPAPDIFEFAARELVLNPASCIVFEDAESGIDAAIAGGFPNVGIGPQERLGHADVRFDSMEEATLTAVRSAFPDRF